MAGDGSGALGDYLRPISYAEPAQARCEYCRRVGPSNGSNCEGCGAQLLPTPEVPFVYDAKRVADLQLVGPDMLIPILLPQN
jgi:hypothetical protein